MRKTEKQLFRAIASSDVAVVGELLSNGANANAINSKNESITPLMLAAKVNNVPAIKLLLDHGADSDTEDVLGRDAYEYAEKYNSKAALLTLMFYVGKSDKTSSNAG